MFRFVPRGIVVAQRDFLQKSFDAANVPSKEIAANYSGDELWNYYLKVVAEHRERFAALLDSMPDFDVEDGGKKFSCEVGVTKETTTEQIAEMLLDVARFSPLLWCKAFAYALLNWEIVVFEG